MSDTFKLEGVPYYSQRDNKIMPFVSCFPTSAAMAMAYCLNLVGKTKTDVGCADYMQLEDYINQYMDSKQITDWMKTQTKSLGDWIWGTARRQILAVETYAFNSLMEKHGFKAEVNTNITYDQLCDFMEVNKLPVPISGEFSSISKVKGHINCVIGFNKVGLRELITQDPYGDALTNYTDTDGEECHYQEKLFIKSKKNNLWVMLIKKTN